MRKVLSAMLALVMVFSLVGTSAWAAEPDGAEYVYSVVT